MNPVTGDDFVLTLKELEMPDGTKRPYSVWAAGQYPRAFDGLLKVLSLDMRIVDPAWIGMKLRKLLTYAEARCDFMARVPGSEKSATFASTEAYIARLAIHRYAMLGILTEDGDPVLHMGVVQGQAKASGSADKAARAETHHGSTCPGAATTRSSRKMVVSSARTVAIRALAVDAVATALMLHDTGLWAGVFLSA